MLVVPEDYDDIGIQVSKGHDGRESLSMIEFQFQIFRDY